MIPMSADTPTRARCAATNARWRSWPSRSPCRSTMMSAQRSGTTPASAARSITSSAAPSRSRPRDPSGNRAGRRSARTATAHSTWAADRRYSYDQTGWWLRSSTTPDRRTWSPNTTPAPGAALMAVISETRPPGATRSAASSRSTQPSSGHGSESDTTRISASGTARDAVRNDSWHPAT